MKKLLIAAVIIICTTGLSHAVMIDDFTDDPKNVGQVTAPAIVTAVRTGSNIIGGTCDITYDKKAGSSQASTYLEYSNMTYNGYTGLAIYNADIFGKAIWTMEYGKNSDLNANLTAGGASSINIDLIGGDLDQSIPVRPIPTTITLISGRGTAQQTSASVTLELLSVGTYNFNFSSFTGVNLADVDYIKVKLDGYIKGQTGHDFAIAGIYTVETPTVVELTDFLAIAGNGQVTLKWETATEINNSGFNILRAKTEKGEYMQINEYLIPSEGSSVTGVNYEFSDDSVKNGKTYWYKLQDVDFGGTTSDSGPVQATPRKSY
jgi:hypothetical protein